MNSRIWVGLSLIALMLPAAGCRSKKPTPAQMDPNSLPLEIAEGPEGARFLAAVEFDRMGEAPSEMVRSEEDLAGENAVLLRPVRLIAGEWNMDRNVRVIGSLYLAASPQERVLGIIVRNARSEPRWFTEFIMKDGKIYAGGTAELVGEESDAAQIVQDTLQQNDIP